MEDQQLYYRILYSKYNPPTEKAKGIHIGQFNLNQWYFIAFDHEGPKSFGRTSSLKVLIDENEPLVFSLEFPKIMSNTVIDQFSIGQNFIGKISSFITFQNQIGISQLQQIYQNYKYGFINDNYQNLSFQNEFLLVSPLQCDPAQIPQNTEIIRNCQWIKTLTIREGFLSITSTEFIFQYETLMQRSSHLSMMKHTIQPNRTLQKHWKFDTIKNIRERRFLMRYTALELFFIDGQSVLLNFSENYYLELIEALKKKNLTNLRIKKYDLKKHTKKYTTAKASIFSYLMLLNAAASRSRKDLSQYPVFPWIIANYDQEEGYKKQRDLSKPVGLIGSKERIQIYQERFQNADTFQNIPPFHYGSHYSSPAIIFQYLVRVQPFTSGAKILQGGKFDIADRMFFSMFDSFRCVLDEVADLRELIPEFFYFPEMFINMNSQEFGITQNGIKINNVIMPCWAKNNPYKFIAHNRKALELSFQQIHNWIDLIFGFKQQGKEAIKNMNVFYYLTYESNVQAMEIQDEKTRLSIETQIINFGQTPIQLFNDFQHLQRVKFQTNFPKITDLNANIKVFKPVGNKQINNQGLKIFNFVQFKQQQEAIVKIQVVDNQKFLCLHMNGQLVDYKWYNTPQTGSNVPFQCGEEKKKQLQFKHIDYSIKYMSFPCAFIQNSKYLVLGAQWKGNLSIMNIDNDKEIQSYKVHKTTITCIQIEEIEQILITGSQDGQIVIWNIDEQNKLNFQHEIMDLDKQINNIQISRILKIFLCAGENGRINVYNLYNYSFYRSIYHPENFPIININVSISPLICVLFFSFEDQTIYSYSINGQLLAKVKEKFYQVTQFRVISDQDFCQILILSNELGEVQIRELPFLELRKSLIVAKNSALCIQESLDKRFIFCGCQDGQFAVLTDVKIN